MSATLVMYNGMSYQTACAAINLSRDASVLDLTPDDFAFLTSTEQYAGNKLWLPIDRSRARRCVEAAVYGALDMLGFPRFPAPVEYIAAVISEYVDPINIQTACLIMEGAEYADNIVNGVEKPVSASQLFAHVLRLRSGVTDKLDAKHRATSQRLRTERNPVKVVSRGE